MSKIKCLLVALLTVTFCFGISFAQTAKTSKTTKNQPNKTNDLSIVHKLSKGLKLSRLKNQLEGIPFRWTIITEKFADGDTTPTEYEKTVVEFISQERKRQVVEKKTPNGINRTENIDIGNESFVRENDGEWKLYKPRGMGMGMGSGEPKEEVIDEKFELAKELVNGQMTTRYKTVTNYKYTYFDRVEKVTITVIDWFNAKGLMVKSLVETNNETKKTVRRVVENYESNVKLKIEKPIVK